MYEPKPLILEASNGSKITVNFKKSLLEVFFCSKLIKRFANGYTRRDGPKVSINPLKG